MTGSGDPLENALAKRVNGILKTEWLDKRPLRNWSEAQAYVEQIIGLYNSLRPHQSLSFLTPDLVHRSGIATLRKWKNYPSQSKGKEVFVPLPAGAESQGIAGNGPGSD